VLITEALELLTGAGATRPAPVADAPPVVSLEWERAWDDRLAPPEIAFPASLAWLRSAAADVRVRRPPPAFEPAAAASAGVSKR
jgi:hypothetical protein